MNPDENTPSKINIILTQRQNGVEVVVSGDSKDAVAEAFDALTTHYAGFPGYVTAIAAKRQHNNALSKIIAARRARTGHVSDTFDDESNV